MKTLNRNFQNIIDAVSDFNGCTFVAVDLKTVPSLYKKLYPVTVAGKTVATLDSKKAAIEHASEIDGATVEKAIDNPHVGRVQKVTTGINSALFRNENSNSYENKVRRNLEKSGQNPEDFQLQPRKWGNRVTGSPFVAHKGALYLEFIAQTSGDTIYLLDGVETPKSEILGLKPTSKPSHGVITRTAKLESVTGLRIGGKRYQF